MSIIHDDAILRTINDDHPPVPAPSPAGRSETASPRRSGLGPSVDRVWVLQHCRDHAAPHVVPAHLLTLRPAGAILVSETPLTGERILLKRITPRFDRKFLECRILPSPVHQGVESPCAASERIFRYGIRFVGFTKWFWLTSHLSDVLLRDGTSPRPRASTQTRHCSRAKRAEQSLMPLLSAIGLVVVYACNLNW